jgi:hypothetical protein
MVQGATRETLRLFGDYHAVNRVRTRSREFLTSGVQLFPGSANT